MAITPPQVGDEDWGAPLNSVLLGLDGRVSALETATPPDGDSGAHSLNELDDVDTSDASDGEVLTYDAGTGQWTPQEVTSSGGGSSAVDSVNGQTGDVTLTADSVGARDDQWVPSYSEVTDAPDKTKAWPVAPSYSSLSGKPNIPDSPDDIGAAAATNQDTTITDTANDYLCHLQVDDDGTPTANWPDRFSVNVKFTNETEYHPTFWLNEYGETRNMPAKSNTVADRTFIKNHDADADHDGNVWEVVQSRDTRTPVARVDKDGLAAKKMAVEPAVGLTLNVGHITLGATDAVPNGTPDGTLILRTS